MTAWQSETWKLKKKSFLLHFFLPTCVAISFPLCGSMVALIKYIFSVRLGLSVDTHISLLARLLTLQINDIVNYKKIMMDNVLRMCRYVATCAPDDHALSSVDTQLAHFVVREVSGRLEPTDIPGLLLTSSYFSNSYLFMTAKSNNIFFTEWNKIKSMLGRLETSPPIISNK